MPSASAWQSVLVKLQTLLIVILIGGVVWLVFPRTPEGSRHKAAVQRIVHGYTQLADKYLAARPDTTPSQYALAMGQFCDALERLDMSDCPNDLEVACKQNIRAIRDGQAVLQQFPESFLEGVASGAMNYLVRGEPDGGLSRLEEEVQRALERIRVTSENVENIAAKYTD